MSTATIAGLGLYAIIIVLALYAAKMAHAPRYAPFEQRGWIIVAVFFAGLAAMRLLNAEERMRTWLRQMIVDQGAYADRWSMQAPFFAVSLLLAAVFFVWILHRWFSDNRHHQDVRVRIALFAVLGFLPLLAVRVISLHATDQLLYHGPVRLNWLLEAGLSCTVAAAALSYIYHSKGWQPPRGRRPNRR